jgi:hypothetical protein
VRSRAGVAGTIVTTSGFDGVSCAACTVLRRVYRVSTFAATVPTFFSDD